MAAGGEFGAVLFGQHGSLQHGFRSDVRRCLMRRNRRSQHEFRTNRSGVGFSDAGACVLPIAARRQSEFRRARMRCCSVRFDVRPARGERGRGLSFAPLLRARRGGGKSREAAAKPHGANSRWSGSAGESTAHSSDTHNTTQRAFVRHTASPVAAAAAAMERRCCCGADAWHVAARGEGQLFLRVTVGHKGDRGAPARGAMRGEGGGSARGRG